MFPELSSTMHAGLEFILRIFERDSQKAGKRFADSKSLSADKEQITGKKPIEYSKAFEL